VNLGWRLTAVSLLLFTAALIMAFANIGSVVATGESFVHITNPANQPVPVAVEGVPFQQQFNAALLASSQTLLQTATFSLAVPEHKRLVVEFVSGSMSPSAGSNPFTFRTTVGGVSATYYLPDVNCIPGGPPQVAGASLSGCAFAEQVHFYADPGTTVTITAYNLSTTPDDATLTVSGRLVAVDLP
jgi:hypothetical protein